MKHMGGICMQQIVININNLNELNLGDLDKLAQKGDVTLNVVKKEDNMERAEVKEKHIPKTVLRGDIWLAELIDAKYLKAGEQGGFRPVLVVQNNVGNKYSPSVIVLCITSKDKRELPTHMVIPKEEDTALDSVILGEQIKTISKERLNRRIGKLTPAQMDEVNEKILFSLGLDGKTR